jgi:hypothetical protein
MKPPRAATSRKLIARPRWDGGKAAVTTRMLLMATNP